MTHDIQDPCFEHLRVCLDHGGLYDDHPEDHGRRQLCHDRAPDEGWERHDYKQWIRLCDCCVAVPIRQGSRWSKFHCDTCFPQIRAARIGIPVGRHSLMDGITMPPLDARGFVDALDGLWARTQALGEWKAARVRQIGGTGDDPWLQDFLPKASVRAFAAPTLLFEWWAEKYGVRRV